MTLSFAPERIEHWPIDRLVPYAANARRHDERQVALLAGSLIEYGWLNPCLVDDAGILIAGHGRVLAARQLGLETVPVIRVAHLTPEQVRAYRIADNKLTEIGGWDEKLLAEELQALNLDDVPLEGLGFTDAELDQLLAFDPDSESTQGQGAPPVVVPEPPRNPVAREGDLWLLGPHRLLCGDATRVEDVRRLMGGERATLFSTDPPYLVDYDGSNHPTRNKIP